MTAGVEAEVLAELALLNLPEEWQTTVHVSARRKSIGMAVDEYAHLAVTVPESAVPFAVARAVRKRLMWVYGQMRQRRPYVPVHPVKELVGGEGFQLLGRNYRLRLVDDGPPLLCDDTTMVTSWSGGTIREIHLRRDHAHAPDALIDWYVEQGHAFMAADWPFTPTAACRRLGVDPPQFDVATLKPRQWTTYRKTSRTLVAHWALFQLDRPEVEFALVRELVKLATPLQTAARRRLASYFCDHYERAEKLALDGRHAWLGDVHIRTETR